jgi:hypothetical protein
MFLKPWYSRYYEDMFGNTILKYYSFKIPQLTIIHDINTTVYLYHNKTTLLLKIEICLVPLKNQSMRREKI